MHSSRPTRGVAPLLAALTLATLAACGGGGNNASPAPAPTPEPPADTRLQVRAITVFGDSLSDVGTYAVATGDPGNPGKFTVNPSKLWVEHVAAHYDLTLSPNRSLTADKDTLPSLSTEAGTATVIGGNNYAEGGARVAALPSQSGIGNNQLVAPVATQIDHYLATHERVGANELVLVDGGGNDTYAQFSALCWGTDDNQLGSGNTTHAIATARIEAAAQAQVDNVKRLLAHGAPLVLVATASDWTATPFARHYLSDSYQASGCYTAVTPAQVTAWTTRFNTLLREGLAGQAGAVLFDSDAPFVDALAHPQQYGLVDTEHPACTVASAAFCTAATLAAPDAGSTYLWSDSFHPSPRGHALLGESALASLAALARPAAAP